MNLEQDLDNKIIEFFADLSKKQQDIPSEFKKIVYDNYWELLEN